MQKTFVKIKTEPIKIETDIKKKKFRSVLKKPHVFCRFDVKMSKVQKRCVEFLSAASGTVLSKYCGEAKHTGQWC